VLSHRTSFVDEEGDIELVRVDGLFPKALSFKPATRMILETGWLFSKQFHISSIGSFCYFEIFELEIPDKIP
jgi:hypothetical protein